MTETRNKKTHWIWVLEFLPFSTIMLMLLTCGVGEDSWESFGLQGDPTSPSWRKPFLNIHWKDWCWSWNSNILATCCEELIWKDPDAEKDWRREEKGMTTGEKVGWHHWLNGHELEKAPGFGDGQGSLVYCSPWGHKESDMTERLNWSYCWTLNYFWRFQFSLLHKIQNYMIC